MRLLPATATVASTGLILAATLQPAPSQASQLWLFCVFCGQRATADAIANVILFLPFGAALAWLGPGRRGLWRWGLALSLGIELTQSFLVGRDASVGDVLTNTLGTLIGVALWRYAAAGARRPAPAAWPLAGAGGAAVIACTSWLLAPAPTDATYYAMWTPALGHVEWYRGRVLDARLDGAPLRPRRLADPAPVRTLVRRQGELAVRFVAAGPTAAVAPLVAVYDDASEEQMLFGPDGDAVVLRLRRHAASWGLDEPDVRFPGAARAWREGDTLSLTLTRSPARACLTAGTARACEPVATPGRAWSLVMYPEGLAPWVRGALDLAWLGGVALIVGWWGGTLAAAAGAGAVLLVTLLAAPLVGGWAAPPAELAATVAGLAAGWAMRRAASRALSP